MSGVGRALLFSLCLFLETLLLAVVGLHVVLMHITHGPSESAGRLFVRSVRETSAIGFLADLYYSPEELSAMERPERERIYVKTDTALIAEERPAVDESGADAWGLVDDDGDGIIIEEVRGEGYAGYMMVVLDRSRVILATDPASYGRRGYTVEQFVKQFGAVAGVNGGAFEDPGGKSNGSIPHGLVVFNGKTYFDGVHYGFAGLDAEGVLHVGCTCAADAVQAGIVYGASFGPALVQNGAIPDRDALESGLNPRTAIGQRSDGAILLLVIDGRQASSLGASYLDEAEVMLSFGAVNAMNMDGGSSSMMWYEDGYVNNCSSIVGVRPCPTAWVVLPAKGGDGE